MVFEIGDVVRCGSLQDTYVANVLAVSGDAVRVRLPAHLGGFPWWESKSCCTLIHTPRNLLEVMDIAGPAGGEVAGLRTDIYGSDMANAAEIVPGTAVRAARCAQEEVQRAMEGRFYAWKHLREAAVRNFRTRLSGNFADDRSWRHSRSWSTHQDLLHRIEYSHHFGKSFAKALSPVLKAEREVKAHRRPAVSDDELFAAMLHLQLNFPHRSGVSSAWDNYWCMLKNMFGNTDNKVLPTPWVGHDWYEHIRPRLPHVSVVDGGQVAYYQTFAKLVAGVTTRIRPGRFLQKFLGDKLSEDAIRKAAEEFSRAVDSENSKNIVRWIEDDDPDGWEWAYEHGHGFQSCMTYGRGDRYLDYRCCGPNHPVRIYAHEGNGLQLAYIGDPPKTPGGRVYARAIVHDRRYVRVYGDSRLAGLLEDMGIYGDATLGGVRVTRRMLKNMFVVPYLDDGDGFDDHGDYLRIVDRDAEIPGDHSNGLAEPGGPSTVTCENCGADVDEDETHYSSYEQTGYCVHCEDDFVGAVTYVTRSGDYNYDTVLERDTVFVGGTRFVDDEVVIQSAGYERCAECDDWELRDDMMSTSRGMVCSCTRTVQLAEEDPDGNIVACEDDTVEVVVVETGDIARLHEDTPIDEGIYRLCVEDVRI